MNIKLRAYSKNINQMIDLYKITPLALDPDLNQDGLFIPFDDSLVLMEFTGRISKDSIEIYEEDILVHPDDEGDVMVIKWNDKASRFEAHRYGYREYTGENSQDVIEDCISFICVDEDAMNSIEIYSIIGNIYTHPQLLQQ